MAPNEEKILRIAAQGDGVTASGRHVPLAAPGDQLGSDGAIRRGPHHVDPPCRHFPICGGCQLQHVDEESLRAFVVDRVLHAAARQNVEPRELLPAWLSPPGSRRRASLHAARRGRNVLLGFKQARTHRIVDLSQCPVLRAELWTVIGPLRAFLAQAMGRRPAEIRLALAEQGVDCLIEGIEFEGLAKLEAALDFARAASLARLVIDAGDGPQTVWKPEPTTISLAGCPVALPTGAFLQATLDAEQRMASDVAGWLANGHRLADLFSGIGTFSFALARAGAGHVLAAEASRDAALACREAAARSRLPIAVEHRDLFRNPLQGDELAQLDGAVLDPPRAGAREQVDRIAQSSLAAVAYVSCNPSSWARDARRLVDAGFRLESLRPVGQFRWSTHVELTSLFLR